MDRKLNGTKWSWLDFRWLLSNWQEGLKGTAVTAYRITSQGDEM
jgi:hypothetical protein